MPLNVGLSTCRSLCQHPGCWNAVRNKQKGFSKSLPPLDSSSSDDSDSELNLPTQSVCNLLSDFGESTTDRYPVSTGGRPSHQWETPLPSPSKQKAVKSPSKKLRAPNNTKASLFSKPKSTAASSIQRFRMPLLEVQEVFDTADLNSHWDETFVTKQYYMWMANPNKRRKKRKQSPLMIESDGTAPVLVKDMTEVMVPVEIEQQREETVLFDDLPVLKKKQPRIASPPCKSLQFKKALPPPPDAPALPLALPAPASNVDMEGINELLALPKDILVKVLEHTKKSDFTSKGKLHNIVQEYVQDNEAARMLLSTRELLKQKKMNIHRSPRGDVRLSHPMPTRPVFQLDNERAAIDRMSSANTPVEDKDFPDTSSWESFPRYTKPLPKINAQSQSTYQLVRPGKLIEAPDSARGLVYKSKLPAISLGLPELPSGIRTTKAFVYNNKDFMDFTLGPMISPPSSYRSSIGGAYSDHGTTVKANAPMSVADYMQAVKDEYEAAIHSVSPALSTHVPVAPAGTPATFMSPTKSAPNLREVSREPTAITINLSIKGQPSSKDMRESTFLSSPASNAGAQLALPMPVSPVLDSATVPVTPADDKALDTIRETARETDADGSLVASSQAGTLGDKVEEPPRLMLQTSTMTNINAVASPAPKSARSVESCPSPEQWPLISESSFEKMVPRSSISEPALSGRSGRRSRGHADTGKGLERDYARKMMDEKQTAESPAPPPPSPEPKDSNEFRARKDLKSRESLSMAPLFEVNEMEESEQDEGRLTDRGGPRKQVRKIHAVIPHAKEEDERKVEAEDESQEVMVSQITVTHVAPKRVRIRDPAAKNQIKEKVQETFLNVDIPAEEIGSCKAEHGSSHQEDISSSNGSVVKSETATTESQVSAGAAGGNDPDAGNDEDYADENNINNQDATDQQEGSMDPIDSARQISLEEQQYLEMQCDNIHRDRYDSARLNSEDSGASPELVCDSARFLSHDLVSPIEDEMGSAGEMRLLNLLSGGMGDGEEEEGDIDTGRPDSLGLEERVVVGDENTDVGGAARDEDGDTSRFEAGIVGGQGEETHRVNKEHEGEGREGVSTLEEREEEVSVPVQGKEREESAGSGGTNQSDPVEPPGSFFFQPHEELADNRDDPAASDLQHTEDVTKEEDSNDAVTETVVEHKGESNTGGLNVGENEEEKEEVEIEVATENIEQSNQIDEIGDKGEVRDQGEERGQVEGMGQGEVKDQGEVRGQGEGMGQDKVKDQGEVRGQGEGMGQGEVRDQGEGDVEDTKQGEEPVSTEVKDDSVLDGQSSEATGEGKTSSKVEEESSPVEKDTIEAGKSGNVSSGNDDDIGNSKHLPENVEESSLEMEKSAS